MAGDVNYDNISERYDNNPIRHQIDRDPLIAQLGDGAAVLDLACGTGLYLKAQADFYAGKPLAFFGADASAGMLAQAQARFVAGTFTLAKAECLPYPDQTFDYLISRFALHHFDDKSAALEEVCRVLKPGGWFKMVNFIPEQSLRWWLYHYFPETVAFDRKRFLTIPQVQDLMGAWSTGVKVVSYPTEQVPAQMIIDEALNRETSELVWLDDKLYERGLARLLNDLQSEATRLIDPGLTIGELVAQRTC